MSLLAEVAEPLALPPPPPRRRSALPLLAALLVLAGLVGSLLLAAPGTASIPPLRR